MYAAELLKECISVKKTQTYADQLSKECISVYVCVCVCVCCAGSVDKLQSNITDDAGVGLALETQMVIFICIFFAYIQSDQLQMSHFCFFPQPHTNLTGQNLIHTHTFSRARALSLSLTQGPETNRVFVAALSY